MPGPAALIALAARLGIPKAAELLAKKGFKYVQKLVSKAQQQVTKQQKTSGKKFTGEGSKRKQEKATQRKKPKVDADLSIKKKKMSAGQLIKADIKRTQDLKSWSKRGPHGKHEQGAKINKGGTTDFTSKEDIAKLKRWARVGRKPSGYRKGKPYWD